MMNLLFSINRKFVPLWEQCMATILRHGGASGYDVYVLHSDLTALFGSRALVLDSRIYHMTDRLYIQCQCSAAPAERLSIDWVRQNTVVVHYLGKPKPWQKGYVGPLGVFYKEELARAGG